jgi:hypothetical protein
MKMVVIRHIRIKALGAAEDLHNIHNADLGKGQEGAVNRIIGNQGVAS